MSARRKVMAASSLLPAGSLSAPSLANNPRVRVNMGCRAVSQDPVAMDTNDRPATVPSLLNRWKP